MLRNLFPGSKVLIVTRGFRALHLSGYSQEVKRGSVLGVKARYEALRRARRELPAQDGVDRRAYRHRDFDYVIALYREAFGRDDVIILPSLDDGAARALFPDGWTTHAPYLRTVAQPGAQSAAS